MLLVAQKYRIRENFKFQWITTIFVRKSENYEHQYIPGQWGTIVPKTELWIDKNSNMVHLKTIQMYILFSSNMFNSHEI